MWVRTSRQARQAWRAAIRLEQCFGSQHNRRPHAAANAADLPATRGGNVENPNANGETMYIAFAGIAASLCFLLFDLVSENHG